MPSERTIRRQLGAQASTYHERAIADLDAENVGRHAKDYSVSSAYPEARPPWNDPAVAATNSAPDPFGVDMVKGPVVGSLREIEAAARPPIDLNADVAAMSDADLQAELARLTSPSGPIRGASKWDTAVQTHENRRIAIEAELARRVFDYAAATDEALAHRKAWAQLAQKHAGLDTDKIDQLQWIVDRCDAELIRRSGRRF